MKSKKFTLVMLAVLLMGMFMLTLRIQLVKAQPSPDVNGDGKVDIADVAIGASAIGTVEGSPRWNPAVDQNVDGKIDIVDIAIIASNFGKTFP